MSTQNSTTRTVALAALLTGVCSLSIAQEPPTAAAASSVSTAPLKQGVDLVTGPVPDQLIQGAAVPHLNYYGGPIVQHPKFYDVAWGASVNSYATMLDKFLMAVGTSLEFNSVLNQYTGSGGATIGLGTFVGSRIATPSNLSKALSDSAIQTQLKAWIGNGTLPANDPNTIYNIFFPPGVQITDPSGGKSCVGGGFCAYHGTATGANGQVILYSVLPDQGPGSGCDRGCGSDPTPLNNVTSVLSHEIAETITDPNVGLARVLGPPLAWYDPANGEIGDICNAQHGTILGWTVQKQWSNLDNACVASRSDFSIQATGVTIPATGSGASTVSTVAVQGQPALTIALSVSGLPAGVTGSFSKTSIPAGQTSTLTLTSHLAAAGSYTVTVSGTSGSKVRSTTFTLGVTSLAQTISFGALANRVFGTAPFAISATATSGLSVSFSSLTTSVCTVLNTTVTLLGAGQCSIKASQAGNASYSAAPAVTQSFTVSQASQTITFAVLPNRAFSPTPFTVIATASSGLPVSFASTTKTICTVSGNSITLLATGLCSITATQAGNANYSAAPAVARSFTITQGSQTISFAALPNRKLSVGSFLLSATASSGLAVSFASVTLPVCNVSGNKVTLVKLGTCSITASQAGNANYAAAPPITQSFLVQ